METEKLTVADFPKVFNTYRPNPKKPKIIYGKSLTVPDQSMTVRQILDRYARGMPLGNMFQEVYNGPDLPDIDFKRMDLAEIEEMVQGNKERVETLQNQLKNEEIAKAKAKEDQRVKELQDLHEKIKRYEQQPNNLFDTSKAAT